MVSFFLFLSLSLSATTESSSTACRAKTEICLDDPRFDAPLRSAPESWQVTTSRPTNGWLGRYTDRASGAVVHYQVAPAWATRNEAVLATERLESNWRSHGGSAQGTFDAVDVTSAVDPYRCHLIVTWQTPDDTVWNFQGVYADSCQREAMLRLLTSEARPLAAVSTEYFATHCWFRCR